MRLLLFSDVHCNVQKCAALVEMSRDVDVVIGASDFGNFRQDLGTTISALKDISRPTVLVPGNSESYDELRAACSGWTNAFVLHGNSTKINGVDFFGIGGGIPITPFGSWSWDFSEDQARELLKGCPEKAVLVTHSPPKGILDVSSGGQSLGSVAIRDVILEKTPQLVVCGHIHESSNMHETLGSSTVINAGPNGIIWVL